MKAILKYCPHSGKDGITLKAVKNNHIAFDSLSLRAYSMKLPTLFMKQIESK